MVDGDSEAIQKLISDAKSAISALTYDESKTLAQNKSRVDAIMTKLASDVDNQRKAELAADKATFEQYKNTRSAATNDLMADGDGNAISKLISDAQSAIAALDYDENKTLAQNKSLVDAIIDQLVIAIQEQRTVDSISMINARIDTGDVQVYTLSGKKISRVVTSGIYIINGKKIMLK